MSDPESAALDLNHGLDDVPAGVPGAGRLAAGAALAGGRYQIVGLIGQGAFGEVYRATEQGAGQAVALRLVSPDLLQGAAERLRAELGIAAKLDHKNIAHTLDFGVEQDLVYIVTEYVDGQTLRSLLQRKRAAGAAAFSLKGAYNVVAHVLNALSYAHRGTLHGALSASNILVNKAGRVKLTEFGLARALPAFARMAAQNPDDLAAMAPEFAAAPASVDRRADIYSVGAVLYELLTGRQPSESLVRPSSVVAGLPVEVDQVIARCLAPAPGDRFGDAMELKNLLHQIVEAKGAARVSSPQPAAAQSPTAPQPRVSAPQPRVSAPQPRVSGAQQSSGIALDESEEKWLIQKNKLDFGPFNFIQVKEQIARNEILPGNIIIDNENGQRCKVEDHPLLHDLVTQAGERRDDARRANAEVAVVKQDKRKGVALYGLIGVGVIALLTGGYFGIKKLKHAEKTEDSHAEGTLESSKLEYKIAFKAPKPPTKSNRPAGPRPPRPAGAPGDPSGFDDDLDLGDASQGGGSERLSNDQMNQVIQANGRKIVNCTGSQHVTIDLIILGTGRVSGVRADGSTTSGMARCLQRAFGSMEFPPFNGPRTKASFDMN